MVQSVSKNKMRRCKVTITTFLLLLSFAYVGHIEASVLNWDCFITGWKLCRVLLNELNEDSW